MNRFRIFLTAVLAPFLVLASCAGNLPRDPEPSDFPVHGIDISRWQGDIDWFSARRGGVSFAFIKATDETPGLAEELQAFVRERLEPYKYPRRIVFMEDLPRTHLGKVDRGRLRNA